MADIQEYLRPQSGAQLLLGLDLRLPHRRGRRQSDQPTGVHARQRLHLRRGLPRSWHAHRRLRPEPVVLLLGRHGPGIQRARPGGAAHLGDRDALQVRRQRALAEAEVPHPDVGALAARAGVRVQRHPHHLAGADRHLRQHQQPAHQRLRRGDHHADRGERAPGAGDPDDHQPRVGAGEEREPQPGIVHHRRADRPGRGGGAASEFERISRARRRARRDGDRLSAQPDPGRSRCITRSRSTTAATRSSASTPSSIRTMSRCRHRSWCARPRRRSSGRSQRLRDFQARNAEAAPGDDRRLQAAATGGDNLFAVLVDAVRVLSLGQISQTLFEVGGQYRRSM